MSDDNADERYLAVVLVAGIGGASLGTEVAKSLRAAGGYRIIGCDISPLAFGHYSDVFDATEIIGGGDYVERVIDVCNRYDVDVVVPGGEQPATLLAARAADFMTSGVRLATNRHDVVALLSDKFRCFVELKRLGFAIPVTISLNEEEDASEAPLPCIVKPAAGSGGSAFVFFARTREEVRLYAAYIRNNGARPIAQEYIPHENGEFTVGILSDGQSEVVGSIALRRSFPAKVSIAAKGDDFLISSGITQGHVGNYPNVTETAVRIARAVKSTGPINIQGRVNDSGVFLPFEINPRFSASTYLRTLAGFNEVDHYVRMLIGVPMRDPLTAKPGWYLRSLTEVVVEEGGLKT